MSSNAFQPHEVGLRNRCRGAVIGPSDEGYDAARQVFNLTTDQHPALIAFPRTPTTSPPSCATPPRAGLRVAPRRTGHNAGPLATSATPCCCAPTGCRASRSTPAPPRPRRAPARAGGTSCREASGARPGRAARLDPRRRRRRLHPRRRHGLVRPKARPGRATASQAIEIVTADGALRRVDAEHEPDLFWALRGGGGNFGVVTALEFDLFPVSRGLRRAACSSRSSRPPTCCTPGASSPASRPTRSPRPCGCCRSRRCRTSPSRCAASRSRWSRPPFLGSEADGRRDPAPAAGPAAGDGHVRGRAAGRT